MTSNQVSLLSVKTDGCKRVRHGACRQKQLSLRELLTHNMRPNTQQSKILYWKLKIWNTCPCLQIITILLKTRWSYNSNKKFMIWRKSWWLILELMLKVQTADTTRTFCLSGRAARANAEPVGKKAKEAAVRNAVGLFLLETGLKETRTHSFQTITINSM